MVIFIKLPISGQESDFCGFTTACFISTVAFATSFHHQQALAHRQSLWSVASPSFCMDLAGPKGV
jgi:hypothetical protein